MAQTQKPTCCVRHWPRKLVKNLDTEFIQGMQKMKFPDWNKI